MALNKRYLYSILFFFWLIAPHSVDANPFLGTEATVKEEVPKPLFTVRKPPLPSTLLQGLSYATERLGDFLYLVGENPSSLEIISILGIAFLYGILHALGPGHRKAIVFSLYLSRQAPVWEPPFVGMALAFLHGATSIAVYLLFRHISGLLSSIAETATFYMEALTYFLLIGIGIWLLLHTLKDLQAHHPNSALNTPQGDRSPLPCISHSVPNPSFTSTPTQALSLSALLLSGLYPCPGAFLILLLAGTLNRMGLGILAVASMSAGSGLILISFAYLGWLGRVTLFKRFLYSHPAFEHFPAYLQIGGYILFLLFSVYLAIPYMGAIVEMFR
ncbi:MAG: hypothetical protein SNJ78_12710 [Spirochaetales bacterium]